MMFFNNTFFAQSLRNPKISSFVSSSITGQTRFGILLQPSNYFASSNTIKSEYKYQHIKRNLSSPSLYTTKQILFGIDHQPVVNLRLQTSDESSESKENEDGSFFRSDLFYFIGAAAIATTFYFVWSDNDKTVTKKTFGTPPKP